MRHCAYRESPPTPYPIIRGHEFAGTAVEVGRDIKPDLPVARRIKWHARP